MANNLNTFRILFLIKGILTLVFSLFFLLYALVGGIVSNIPEVTHGPGAPPFNPGIIFLIVGIVGFFFCVVIGTLTVIASKFIREQKKYTFIFAVSIINCLTGILGILLCIFTLIELTKPHVKELFGQR